ncbi:MAG: hypothetical protein ACYC26_13555 [Phycisphaerales bacterium]
MSRSFQPNIQPNAQPSHRGRHITFAAIIVSGIGLFLALMVWPTLIRLAEEPSSRRPCPVHITRIMNAMLIYSLTNHDQFPPDLNILVNDGSITPDMLHCPDARSLSDTANYIYVYPNTGFNSAPDAILLYEPLRNHRGEGMNIAFGDGHTLFFNAVEARSLLEKQGLKVVE